MKNYNIHCDVHYYSTQFEIKIQFVYGETKIQIVYGGKMN